MAAKKWGGPRKGAGRKPVPPEERRRNKLMVSLTDDELARLEVAAGDEPAATWIRRVVLRQLERARARPTRRARGS